MYTLLIVLAVILVYVTFSYNNLVKLRNRYKNAFSQIDVQLRRRYDLIPNLIEVAKKYMSHEKETLEAVIEARSKATSINVDLGSDPLNPELLKKLAGAESALSSSLGKLLAVSENYPDLKANQTMMQLSEELTATENKVSFARQNFNDEVTVYNTAIEQFPGNVIAGLFDFLPGELWLVEDETVKERVSVDFD